MALQSVTIQENEVDGVNTEEWTEFCKKEVTDFADKFAKSWKLYLGNRLSTDEVLPKTVAQKVAELLPQILEDALHSPSEDPTKIQNGIDNITSNRASTANDSTLEATSDENPESPSLKISHKPFFRRLSFKGLKKGKSLFLKQHSDEVELSPHHERHTGERSKLRTVKLSAECIRDGTIQLLNGDTNEGQLNWVKSRMTLVKLGAGHIIEFYSPPKVRHFICIIARH